MKKILVLLLLLACVALLPAQDDICTEIERLAQFYPADENSDGEIHIRNYIENRLEKAGIMHQEAALNTLSYCHSFSKNIYAEIPGTSDKTLVIAVPVTGFSGAFNVALALEMAERFSQSQHQCNIRLIFLGAEFDHDGGFPVGSRVYMDSHSEDDTVLYLNFHKIPGKVVLQTGNEMKIAPYWMMENVSRALSKSGLEFDLRPEQNVLCKLGMKPHPSPLDAYLAAGMNAIMLYDDEGEFEIEPNLTADSFYRFLEEFSNSELKKNDNADTNYLVIHWNDSYYIAPELFTIASFLIIMGMIIVYMVFHSRQSWNYMHLLAKNVGIILRTAAAVFVSLMASAWITEGLLKLSGLDTQWQKLIPELLLLKVMICVTMFVSTIPFLSKYRRHNLENLYTGAAIASALLNLLLFMVIELSLAIYFVWCLVCTFMFAVSRRKKIKFLFMLMSGLFFYLTVQNIIFYPAINLCKDFIFSPPWHNAYLTIVILPFIFMGIRIFHSVALKKELSLKVAKITGVASLIFCTILTLRYVFVYSPYGEENWQPVHIDEVYDLDVDKGSVTIWSNYKLGSIQVITGKEELNIFSKEKRLLYDMQKPEVDVNIGSSTRSFLERKITTLRIESQGRASRLHIALTPRRKDEKLIVLDSTYPYRSDGDRIVFFIGKNQPMPFEISITTQKECRFDADVEIVYTSFPFKFSFAGDNQFCIPSLALKKHLTFED